VVRALVIAELEVSFSRQLANGVFEKLLLFTQQRMNIRFSSKSGKAKALRKRSGLPPQ